MTTGDIIATCPHQPGSPAGGLAKQAASGVPVKTAAAPLPAACSPPIPVQGGSPCKTDNVRSPRATHAATGAGGCGSRAETRPRRSCLRRVAGRRRRSRVVFHRETKQHDGCHEGAILLDRLLQDFAASEGQTWNVARVLDKYEASEPTLRHCYDKCRSLETRIIDHCITPRLKREEWEARQAARQAARAGTAALSDEDDHDMDEDDADEEMGGQEMAAQPRPGLGRATDEESKLGSADEDEDDEDDEEASLPRLRRSVPVLPHGGGSALRAGSEHLAAVRSLGMLLYYSIVEAQRRAVAAAAETEARPAA